MRDTLIVEVSSGIGIVEIETNINLLTGIYRELCIDMILAIGLVSTVVVEYIRVGRQGVHEQELLGSFIHKTIGLGKDEDVALWSVDEDPAQAWCIVAACMVVFTIHATVESGVHEQMGDGVWFYEDPVTEFPVKCPCVEALGNLLVARSVVVVFVEVLIIVALCDISCFVNLAKCILSTDS